MIRVNLQHASQKASRRAVALATLLAALSPAFGATPARAGDWKFSATPYVWATNLGVKADFDGRTVVDENVSVNDLVKKLDTTFQGRFEVRYHRVGLSTDLFDVTMSDHVEGAPLPQGLGTGSFSPDIRLTIFDVAASYSPPQRRRLVSFLAGTRVIYQRADVDADYDLAGGGSTSQSYGTHETLVDALVGVRVTQPLSRHWGVQGQADVSAGGTRYTWSAGPSLQYVFDASRRYALSAGYRHMHVDFQEQDGFTSVMNLSGALIGFRVSY